MLCEGILVETGKQKIKQTKSKKRWDDLNTSDVTFGRQYYVDSIYAYFYVWFGVHLPLGQNNMNGHNYSTKYMYVQILQ